jgi:hypothetical protein
MSGGSKDKGKKKADDNTDESEVVHRPKSKTRISVPERERADEDEIITSRTRSALTKSNSFKTVVGQTSSKSVKKSSRKSDEQDKKKKPSKVDRAAIEPMEVDDDRSSRSSLAPASVPAPRRGAAAKALRRLHDTVMPDLVNYEAQLQKAKGKSTGSLNAFALDFEDDQARDTGKRKKTVHKEEEGDESGEEAKPKKKRRLSDVNEGAIHVKGKTKGKQKMKEESVEAERSRP